MDTNDLQVKIKTPHDLVIDRKNNMRQQTPQTATIEYDSYLRDKSVTIAGNSAWQLGSTFVTLILGVKQFYKIEYYISMRVYILKPS